jgi:ribosomal subunit interface protein
LKKVTNMRVETRTIGFRPTEALLQHVASRLATALAAFSKSFIKATVRLEDVNADHGGIDKRCSIVVALRRRRVALAESTDSDLYVAIEHAARKIHRAVSTAVTRRRAKERKDRQRPGALITS